MRDVPSRLKWLYPGMRVKRWIFLVIVGTLVVTAGASVAFGLEVFSTVEHFAIRPLAGFFGALPTVAALVVGGALVFCGGGLIVVGFRQTIRSLMAVFLPGKVDQLADIVFERRQLPKGPRIVVIGGGSGLSTLLRGLKNHTENLTAIVTMADDGGSSGRIRTEFGMPPPGDVRNTLVALADTEPLMERLFQYRFKDGEGLKDHNFGNLFIAAMTDISGDFQVAVREFSKVLAVRGRVYPSTLDSVVLVAEYEDGSVAEGESRIPFARKKIRRVALKPARPAPLPAALAAIREADGIVLGPGSLYTSILPNLLLPEIADAIRASNAAKMFVCNVMTQPGETDGYTASDHVLAVKDHVGDVLVRHVIVNESSLSRSTIERYLEEGASPVTVDADVLEQLGVATHLARLVPAGDAMGELARHDPDKLARAVMDVVEAENEHAFWEERVMKPFMKVAGDR